MPCFYSEPKDTNTSQPIPKALLLKGFIQKVSSLLLALSSSSHKSSYLYVQNRK